MARLRGRAKVVLDEARERMEKARLEYKAAQQEAERAQIVFEAHADAYDSLQRALAPASHQSTTAARGKLTASTKRIYERCAQCDKTKGHRFHKDSSDDGYHPFVPPAQPAHSPSSPSNGAASSTANIGTSTAGAPDAVHVSSGGQ